MTAKPSLATILSFNGGYVDTAGFLTLQGLFTAHVTGNFVTFGAALVHGSTGAYAKLLALPVFCAVVILTRLASHRLMARRAPVLGILLGTQVALLAVGAIMAMTFGPFANGDLPPALLTGMVLVAAMAVQNATHRAHLSEAPPSTLMTGTTTQIMIDLADMACGAAEAAKVRPRIIRMATSVAAFALGCGMAAVVFMAVGPWCFVLPPLLVLGGMLANPETIAAPLP